MNRTQKETLLNMVGGITRNNTFEILLSIQKYIESIEVTEEPLELKAGQIVKLINGTVIGPLKYDGEEGIRFPFYASGFGSWTSSGKMLIDEESNKDIVEIIANSGEELLK